MLFQNSIGIDIRAESFSVVALKDGFKGVRLSACNTVGFDGSLHLNDRVKVIADVVNEMSRQEGMGPAEIFVAIPREHVIVREIGLPLSVKENLRATLGYEMPKYVPLPADEIYFDYLITEENRSQNTLRILLFAMRKRDLDGYLPLATHLGRNLGGIEIGATAFAGFLEFQGPGGEQTSQAVIRAGNKSGEICIYRGGRLEYSKLIQPTDEGDDLAAELAANLETAENQRQGIGGPFHWSFYGSPGSERLLDRIREKASREIDPVSTGNSGLPSADFAPAYGLACKGLRDAATKVNLLPEKLRKKPSRIGYYTMLALVLLTLISVVSWSGSLVVRHRMALSGLNKELSGLQEEVKEIENMVRQAEAMESRIETLAQLRSGRIPTLVLLNELSTRVPTTAWIQEFALQKGGVQIVGLADSAREIVELLEDSPVFEEVVFLSAITKDKNGKERFRIGMGLQ
ncbi:MAG: PilN domain-containing protein [Thermodesulfobacteriota bacterium]